MQCRYYIKQNAESKSKIMLNLRVTGIVMRPAIVVNHFAVGNLLFWQSLRISECIPDTIVF